VTDPVHEQASGGGPRRGVGALEWALAAVLLALAAALVASGLGGAPSDAALLERARGAAAAEDQVRATHALVLRGYWEVRPLAELEAHLDACDPAVRTFVTTMHGSLLRPR